MNSKAKIKTMHTTIREHISRVVMGLKEKGVETIDPDYVANIVNTRIDIHSIAPHLTAYLALMELKQQTRAFLRHTLDPVQIMADKIKSGQQDAFEHLLQDHYPVKRDVMGKKKGVYVTRESMTKDEVDATVDTLMMAGGALIKHAKALKAWFYSK